ncbi:hypothetical protein TI39_contig4114g00004 [Zymoseptoria brevis]|uniref:Carbonic anhydrase n=1 Tax=Zymoseptoria brevis TaxID=1047168 RepID=A0A0F4GGU6_9PEZI|nr:hypothetical protein TI39_contig4114g00004 [Zymoseptoria brevis]
MDARIDPAAAFGIDLGDVHHLLGTREIILVKHTGCGMLTFQNTDALKAVASNVGAGVLVSTYDFQPFGDLAQAVRDDVAWLQGHSALVERTVSGWVYQVETGKAKRSV